MCVCDCVCLHAAMGFFAHIIHAFVGVHFRTFKHDHILVCFSITVGACVFMLTLCVCVYGGSEPVYAKLGETCGFAYNVFSKASIYVWPPS